jgi:hypothetical protein
MPRRHRSARERAAASDAPPRPTGVASEWALLDGYTVRAVSGEKGKPYRCPGCQQLIHPGTPHLVVMPEGSLQDRRHWHSPCWRRELKLRRPSGRA